MPEPTRRLANPDVADDGSLHGKSVTTPDSLKIRGALAVPPSRVIPVIVVPGVMGTNLRAKMGDDEQRNAALRPGEPAWRPPNGSVSGLMESFRWSDRDPMQRQRILDPDTLEVDNTGEIDIPSDLFDMHAQQMRKRWWGEVHLDSYGELLYTLQRNLNHTFDYQLYSRKRFINDHWKTIIQSDRAQWDAVDMPALTEEELEKYARYQYPVYACGYNWLQSCEKSAERLKNRVLDIIRFWTERKHHCTQVILVTHSMGGLVARACARQIPDKIAGIVHGVMPALGAPICYRRLACGMESASPGNGWFENFKLERVGTIVGLTTEETTAVMATAPGPLELLPNHLYPGPWLFASVRKPNGEIEDILKLPEGSPYDLYRNMQTWYRLINPEIADPTGKYKTDIGGIAGKSAKAIKQAERFHTKLLDIYYHPNTYAYYGVDENYQSYGVFRWIAESNNADFLSAHKDKLKSAAPLAHTYSGGRNVHVHLTTPAGGSYYFVPSEQDTNGDGTVPHQSGAGPKGKTRRVFRTQDHGHQDSYQNEQVVRLTQHLIVKITQEVKQ